MKKHLLLIMFLASTTFAQHRLPAFEDHRVRIKPIKTPASINVDQDRFVHRFRTVLNRKAKSEGINFAGKYTVLTIGSGSVCHWMVIVDRINGKPYVAPFNYRYGFSVRHDSRLLVMDSKDIIARENGSPEAGEADPAYFVWNGRRLVQIGPRRNRPILIEDCPYNELIIK